MPRVPARWPKAKVWKSPADTGAHLQALIESTRDMIWSVDLNYRLVTFNKAVSDEFKYNHGIRAKAGLGPVDLLTPDRAALWPPLYERALKEGRFQTEYRMADGRYLELELNPIVEDGRKAGVWVFSKDITERKATRQSLARAIEALRATEERYHAAFQTSMDAVSISRLSDGMYIDANKAFLDLFGFSREEVIGRTSLQLGTWVNPHDRENMMETMRREGKCRNLEFQVRKKNGEKFWSLFSASIIEVDGAPCVLGVRRDITEQKAAQQRLAAAAEALRVSEARYRAAFENSADCINIIRLSDRKYVDVNQAFLDITGFRAEEVIGRTPQEIGIWADPSEEEKTVSLLQRTSEVRNLEIQLRRKNGTTIWGLTSAAIIEIDGQPHVLVVTRDITGHKAAREALERAEQKFRDIFTAAPEGIFQTTPEGKVLAVNPACAIMLGYSPLEDPCSVVHDLAHDIWLDPRERTRFVEYLERHGEIEGFSCQVKCKDGAIKWVSISARKTCGADGKTLYYQGFIEDLTSRMAAEEARRKAEQRFREIFEDAPEGIFQVTPEGRALAFNPATAEMLGYKSAEEVIVALQNTAHDLWPDSMDLARFMALLEQQGAIRDYRHQLKRRDGSLIWASTTARKICGPDGKTICYQGFTQDITERKRLEAALQANSREFELLSEINNALVRAKTEKDLLRDCCRIMVETGGYRMAWVGFADEGPNKPLVTIADYGCEEGFLESINLTWAETGREDGPVCRSLRTGEVQVEEDICADPLVHSWRTEAVKHGYRMAIALPFPLTDGTIASLAVFGERPTIRSGSERRLMEQIASDIAYGIANHRAEAAKAQHQEDLRAALEQTIHVMAETVDQRDPYTAGHQRRVADLCMRIAQKLGLPDDRAHGLHLAASIHDLGKIGIPAEILSKPGLLTPTQFNLLKEHAQLGYDILKNVAFPWPIADMILQHHERLDGSGYPHGLKGDAISLEARILAVADIAEAMSSHRPYRAAKGVDAALDEILAQRGTHYDAQVVDACVRVFREDGYEFPAQAS
jgi:PAS domain S-box-containing protein